MRTLALPICGCGLPRDRSDAAGSSLAYPKAGCSQAATKAAGSSATDLKAEDTSLADIKAAAFNLPI